MRRAPLLLSIAALIAACRSRSEPAPAPVETEAPVPAGAIPSDPPAAEGALAPNLHAAGDGILATWLEPSGDGRHRLQWSRWSGGTWSPAQTITDEPRIVANWADVPSIARGGDGALVAHWAEASGPDGHAYDAVVARSTDGGQHWTRLGALHDDGTVTEHGFVSLLAEPEGVRAFWLDGRAATGEGGAMTLRTARVADAVTEGEIVDARVCDCCGTAAVATASGPVVAYRDRDEDELRDIATSRRGLGGWASPGPIHPDGWQIAGCPVNGPALAAAGRRVAIAWYTYAGSTPRVQLAFSDDDGASFAAPIEVDAPRGARAPLGRVALVLADDGTAIVGWLASDREDGAVLARRVGADGRVGAEVRLGGSRVGRDAGFPRLARSGDRLLAMWTEPGPPSRLRALAVPVAAIPPLATAADPASAAPAAPTLPVGSRAPVITTVALDGKPASTAGLRGQVVLVNLWATWCEPCRHELPVLADLHRRDAGRGLAIVAINVDRQRSRDEIAEFVARRSLPFAVWLDPHDRAATALGASTYPVNVLIDRDGQVVWRRDGAIRADDPELRAALDAALE